MAEDTARSGGKRAGFPDSGETRLGRVEELTRTGCFEAEIETGRALWSEGLHRLLGVVPGEVEPSLEAFLSHIHPEDRPRLLRSRNEALAGLKPYDIEFRYFPRGSQDPARYGRLVGEVERNEAGWPVRLFGTVQDITRRRLAEDGLSDSEERFRRLAENAADVIFRWSFERPGFDYVNRAATDVLGLSPEDLYRDCGLAAGLVHPGMAQWFETAWGDFSRGRIEPMYEYKIRRPDGQARWLFQRNVLVRGAGGEPLFLEGIVTDITERRLAEEALRESEERFRALFEDAPLPYQSLDEHGRFLELNRTWLATLGYERREVLGRGFWEFTAGVDQAEFAAGFARTRESGVIDEVEFTLRRKDGTTLLASFTGRVQRDAAGDFLRTHCIFIDITARRQAEQRLRLLSQAVEQSSEGIGITDLAGRLVFVNRSLAAMHGHSVEELLGRHVSVFHAPDTTGAIEAASEQLLRTGSFSSEFIHRRVDGSSFPVDVNSCLLHDEAGNPAGQVGVIRDITERRRMERELEASRRELEERVRLRTEELLLASERVRTLTRMLIRAQESERQRVARDLHDNVAQDLSSLKLACETLLDDEPGASEALRRKRAELLRSIQGVIDSVRELSQGLHPSGLEHFGLARAVARQCEEFERQRGVAVDFFAAGVDALKLDPQTTITLYRLVQEALNNAGRHARAAQVSVRLVASHPNLILRVEDDGVGFDPRRREAEAFAEKRMGLSGMRERAGLLGGHLDIQSRPGRGTRIVITIPCGGTHG